MVHSQQWQKNACARTVNGTKFKKHSSSSPTIFLKAFIISWLDILKTSKNNTAKHAYFFSFNYPKNTKRYGHFK